MSKNSALHGLSGRLALLDLVRLDGAAGRVLVCEEAQATFGYRYAALWRYDSASGGCLLEVSADGTKVLPARRVRVPASSFEAAVTDVRLLRASWSPAIETDGHLRLTMGEVSAGDARLLLLGGRQRERSPNGAGVEVFAQQATALLRAVDMIERARRTETRLAALYDTTMEISTNLELEAVLGAIVERSRRIAHTPIAYIMLEADGAREIEMRLARGTRSPQFEALRLELGTGLGGTVARDERAVYTSDYLNDDRFHHGLAVDDAVRSEGIKSILGVPVKAFDRLLGVLLVADRVIRVFDEGEVDVLASLAHHAAFAIQNARLYERATQTLHDLEEANATVRAQNARLRRADEFHAQLSDALVDGRGLDEVVSMVSEVLGAFVVVLDHDHRLLAFGGEPADDFGRRFLDSELSDPLRDQRQLREFLKFDGGRTARVMPAQSPLRLRERLILPLVTSGDEIGSVWVETDDPAEDQPLVEQAVRAIALELVKEQAVLEFERRVNREFVDDLLSDQVADNQALRRRAVDFGISLTNCYRLLVATVGQSDVEDAPSRATESGIRVRLRNSRLCHFVGEYGGGIIALIGPEAGVSEVRDVLAGVATEELTVRGVLSPPARCDELRMLYDASDRLLRLTAKDREVTLIDLEQMRVIPLLFSADRDLERFVEGVLGPVLKLSSSSRDELLRTLARYLDAQGNVTRTAAALHVHVNTVYYRLARLRDALGDDFDASTRRLDLQVALLGRRLLGSRPARPL